MGLDDLRAAVTAAARLPGAVLRRGCAAGLDLSSPSTAGGQRQPVLLAHGYVGTDTIWEPLSAALRANGFGHVVRVSYDSLRIDVPELTAAVAQVAREALATTGAAGVHLVGHSLGGLLLHRVAQDPGLALPVTTVVTIASPHRGLPLARLAPGPCGRLMRPRATALAALPTELPVPAGTRWLSYSSSDDRVVPAAATRLDERLSALHVQVHGAGHLTVCRHPLVVAGVVRQLVAAEGDVLERAAAA